MLNKNNNQIMRRRYGIITTRKIKEEEKEKDLVEREDEQSIFILLRDIILDYVQEAKIRRFYDILLSKEAQDYYPLANKSEEEKINFFYDKLEIKEFEETRPYWSSESRIDEGKILLNGKMNDKAYYVEDNVKVLGVDKLRNAIHRISFDYFHKYSRTTLYEINRRGCRGFNSEISRYLKLNKKDEYQIEELIPIVIKKYIYFIENLRGSINIFYQENKLFEKKILDLFKSNFIVAKKLYVKKLLNILTEINEDEYFKGLWTEDLLTLLQDLIKSDKHFQEESKQDQPLVPEKELIDYSDTNNVEKIIFLHKLGVLEYLRTKDPFNVSTNLLAEYLSGVTGIKATTVQSYINPIINKNVQQNKSALHNINTVNKVEQKLIKIGCNVKDLLS